ncbi:hypothetical protein MTQ01_14415 [Streptomyces sp. XM4193]|uniref:hypothetical protein n=1 Tax=Streptomyces sp. XM4193 TaxID=2929782 RepID=UPI001FF9BD4E|nr:hypothetical protein [Streptomyces sp. XM4193]MCK1797192.1 hypothetical protein [Streptomyces sp. XM4193]
MALDHVGGTNGSGELPTADGDLVLDSETLTRLRKQVDLVANELRDSSASEAKVRQQIVARDAYGGANLAHADDLSKAYDKARVELERYVRIFSEQIEALSLVVEMSKKGFDNAEEEQIARFHKLQENAREHYRTPEPRPDTRDERSAGTGSEAESY